MSDAAEITPAQFFEELLPAGFKAEQETNPNREETALQYHITGEGGGDWLVKIAGGEMSVQRGVGPALIAFRLAAHDVVDAVTGRNGANPTLLVPRPRKPGASTGPVKALKGTMAMELSRPETPEPFRLEMIFNGGETPRTVMKLTLADHIAIQEGRLNGQEAFMTGKMKVEGDIAFLMAVAMATQV